MKVSRPRRRGIGGKPNTAPDLTCYACQKPIEGHHGVGKLGPIHWSCYDEIADRKVPKAAPLLQERVEALMETLQTIADFAVGNGDVCEIIAKRARAAVAEAERVLQEKP